MNLTACVVPQLAENWIYLLPNISDSQRQVFVVLTPINEKHRNAASSPILPPSSYYVLPEICLSCHHRLRQAGPSL
jgi:hypothetical protein